MAMASAAVVRQQILARFPGPFSFCFAYGSGVKQQLGYADLTSSSSTTTSASSGKPPPMIDLVLCVDDAQRFHQQNLDANPADYSTIGRLLGSRNVSRLQRATALGAGVYCNTLVPVDDGRTMIKYGVVSTDDVLDDLLDWRHLYVAGRLHKPVEVLHEPEQSGAVQAALRRNRDTALRMALLRLPESFGYFELFYTIANLSYAGDFRMYFGEKRDKVRNIVQPQLGEFRDHYDGQLAQMQRNDVLHIGAEREGDGRPDAVRIVQNKSAAVTVQHLRALPAVLRQAIGNDAELEQLVDVGAIPELQRRLAECTERIVWRSSVGQSLKNIPTAGLGKSVRYSWQKVLKTFNM